MIISVSGLVQDTPFESALQFFSALPAFVMIKYMPDGSEFLAVIFYFVYWAALGGLVGLGLSKGRLHKAGVVLLVLVFAFCHYKANIIMQKEIEGAVSAFIGLISTY